MSDLYLKLNRGSLKEWIFEGDFEGCFDNINHQHIMTCISSFPNKNIIQKWLESGYVDNDVFHKTDKGTPQGGIISPLLANIALHGMEEENWRQIFLP